MWHEQKCPRRWIAVGLMACFFLLAVDVHSEEADANTPTVRQILANFEQQWDDGTWKPHYLRPLDDAGWKARMIALQEIVRRGDAATGELVKGLQSESALVRSLAAQSLGYIPDGSSKPALAKVVQNDSDAQVRLYAADSLGMLGAVDHKKQIESQLSSERNRDTKRHLSYALARRGKLLSKSVTDQLLNWKAESIDSAKVGKPAPDFTLESLDGQQVALSSFRGKRVVVLVFLYGDT